MSGSAETSALVRHFRQIVLWPLQLVPEKHTGKIQRHWVHFSALAENNRWVEAREGARGDSQEGQQARYREFVTFLPFVQRFLYGSGVGFGQVSRDAEPSTHLYRREDIAGARVTYASGVAATFVVTNVALYFFLDTDTVVLAFEMSTDDIPLPLAQETMFRFGRAYPGFWENGDGAHCPRLVEWLDAGGSVLAASDYGDQQRYLDHVATHRAPRLSAHWRYLLEPLQPADSRHSERLRFRPLEYYRMPFMAYLAVDDPAALSRADFARIAHASAPGDHEIGPFSEPALADFESAYCEDRYFGRVRGDETSRTRIIASGRVLAMVGRNGDPLFNGRMTGLFAQFRHQYFLLFLIAHFHRSALLSMSDQLAVAMNRLEVGDTESVKQFKRSIRQATEIFLRFTHRYWYHQISNQDLARSLFQRTRQHLATQVLYDEVRQEMMDMNGYLDSDSLRRQANTVLRLTVVTIFAMIGTIATGFLGMNLIAAADDATLSRVTFFVVVLVVTALLTALTIAKSRSLAELLDTLSNERMGWRERFAALRGARRRRRAPL